jgi:hypothetical protein
VTRADVQRPKHVARARAAATEPPPDRAG